MDLALNIGVTAAIALKVWSIQRKVAVLGIRSSGNQYNSVIWTIVESGLLFTTATLVTVSLYLSGSHAVVVALDSTIQLAVSVACFITKGADVDQ